MHVPLCTYLVQQCAHVPLCSLVRTCLCATLCARASVQPCAHVPLCNDVCTYLCAALCACASVQRCVHVPLCMCLYATLCARASVQQCVHVPLCTYLYATLCAHATKQVEENIGARVDLENLALSTLKYGMAAGHQVCVSVCVCVWVGTLCVICVWGAHSV